MGTNPPHDRIFKRLMQLSSPALINFINGLFGTAYPPDSTVEFLETDTDNLNRWVCDRRLLINHKSSFKERVTAWY